MYSYSPDFPPSDGPRRKLVCLHYVILHNAVIDLGGKVLSNKFVDNSRVYLIAVGNFSEFL